MKSVESLELLLCASDSGTKAKRGASPGVPAGVDGASRRNGRAWVTAVGRCGSTRDTTCNVPNTRMGNRCTGPSFWTRSGRVLAEQKSTSCIGSVYEQARRVQVWGPWVSG